MLNTTTSHPQPLNKHTCWLTIASVNLAVAVALGAFGAHGLKKFANAQQLAWWHTATDYFFYHALGLLVMASLIGGGKLTKTPAYVIQTGIIIFCGSLYSMALGAPTWLGAVTPIGGVCFIVGWLLLAYHSYRLTSLYSTS